MSQEIANLSCQSVLLSDCVYRIASSGEKMIIKAFLVAITRLWKLTTYVHRQSWFQYRERLIVYINNVIAMS